VQRISRITVVAVAIVGFAVAVLAGCESKSDAANRKVLAAVTEARRLHGRALSLLANPVQKIGGELDPLAQPAAPPSRQIEVLPASVLNPVALESLEQAERTLSGAMSKAGRDASPYTTGTGYNLLGQICLLKGFYHAGGAAEAQGRAQEAAEAAQHSANLAGAYEGLGQFYEQLSQVNDRDLLLMRSQAAQEARQAREQIATLEGKIAALAEQKRELEEKLREGSVRARDLRINSRLAKKEEGLKLLEQALAVETQVNVNSSEVSHIENTIELHQLSLEAFKTDMAAAEQRQQLAAQLLADRQQQNAQYVKGSRDVQEALGRIDSELDTHLGQVAIAAKQAGEAETLAVEAYEEAIRHFQAARRAGDGKTQADLNEANAQMSLAELHVRTLRMKAATGLLHKQLAEAMPGGPAIEDVDPSSTPDVRSSAAATGAGAIRSGAAKAYQRAAELYDGVLRRADRNVKWIYQGQFAAANLGLYSLTGDAETLKNAKTALQEALDGRRGSRYLESVEQLERLAGRL